MLTVINNAALRGWNVLLPSENTVQGVMKALDSITGRYDARRAGRKADDSDLALSLLAAAPERWSAVTVCNPGPVPDGLDRVRGVAVHIVAGVKSDSLAAACDAFNRLADAEDRISDADRLLLKERKKAWRKADNPLRSRGYEPASGRHLIFHRQSGRVGLSVCDTARVVSHSPELDFLAEALESGWVAPRDTAWVIGCLNL